ncbi:uncharacterized protein DEA37_0013652 [Paragonimus westermani]|uniref:Ig-like domain-containing protein n=1 Tax=Paragonimus westermani TaxID=34504 RepID=A0A5J4NPT3_9TREM|nr:uncharacterized protein DEA37_0013652 [Paragonimus westermani]
MSTYLDGFTHNSSPISGPLPELDTKTRFSRLTQLVSALARSWELSCTHCSVGETKRKAKMLTRTILSVYHVPRPEISFTPVHHKRPSGNTVFTQPTGKSAIPYELGKFLKWIDEQVMTKLCGFYYVMILTICFNNELETFKLNVALGRSHLSHPLRLAREAILKRITGAEFLFGPAKIVQPPLDTKAIAGESVLFYCQAEGNPIPRIVFKWNDHELVHNRPGMQLKMVSPDSISLRAKLEAEHNGNTVTCFAQNQVGSDSATAQITVYGTNETNLMFFLLIAPATKPFDVDLNFRLIT